MLCYNVYHHFTGYYCNFASGPITDYTLYKCPSGHYCPNGTKFATEYGCLAGTYNPGTALKTASECPKCPAGKYCGSVGLSNVTGRLHDLLKNLIPFCTSPES